MNNDEYKYNKIGIDLFLMSYIAALLAILAILVITVNTNTKLKSQLEQEQILNDTIAAYDKKISALNHKVNAQQSFFDKFLAGHWQDHQALEACRVAFAKYVEFNSKYIADSNIFKRSESGHRGRVGQ